MKQIEQFIETQTNQSSLPNVLSNNKFAIFMIRFFVDRFDHTHPSMVNTTFLTRIIEYM